MKKILEFLVRHSGKLCAFAIGVAEVLKKSGNVQ